MEKDAAWCGRTLHRHAERADTAAIGRGDAGDAAAATVAGTHLAAYLALAPNSLSCTAPVERYAELVQQFQASESHHHAYPGGMLDHGLEIVAYALKPRQSHLLPAGDSPDEQSAQAEAWTAGTAYAALLHDIGKIAVDLYLVRQFRTLGSEGGHRVTGVPTATSNRARETSRASPCSTVRAPSSGRRWSPARW